MSESEPTPDAPEPSESSESMGNDVQFRVMTVGSVRFDLGDPSPQIHLMEEDSPYRNISITVALSEAQSLHNALIGAVGLRPSTHELTTSIIAQLQADIIAVRILRHENGVFYSQLDLMTARGREPAGSGPDPLRRGRAAKLLQLRPPDRWCLVFFDVAGPIGGPSVEGIEGHP